MEYQHLVVAGGSVATVTLSRPEVHNAFNAAVVAEVDACFRRLGADPAVRVIVLTGAGRSFSAGADLKWMREAAAYTEAQNRADALGLARMLATVDACPKPVVARVNGAALGGGAGLVAVCDVAVAAAGARIGFSEVRFGLVPATISPYVVRKIGAGQARALFLLAEPVDAAEAHRIGLVHRVAPPEELDAAVDRAVATLLAGGPEAQAVCKHLVRQIAAGVEHVAEHTADIIAARRASPEGQEGIRAFLERRPPSWAPDRRRV